ncbi:endonuclease [Marinigracilibium pacificum]|uniref:Endonuclease I n=1 Tax=Marinigracilibium pacificum TaxID=2729599 RepID=A0A848IWS6_9BACT|nr:endonuclease [Marinigracilibium pacificum]NMM48983.1 endonuclease I [Marinigracilibium pacificum]
MNTIRLKLLFLLFSSLSFYANSQILNGSFESWSSNTPQDWTTIDNGISIAPATSPNQAGSKSAKITVLTTTQSSTDFRQTISVTPGQAHTFSVWVYHTEGNVSARLYIDGYRNYSDKNLTGQWQKIEYTYAPVTSSIEIGLRFYDQPGFDGNEIVYVDNFQPGDSSTPPDTGGGCTDTQVTLSITTDNYGAETSWVLKNEDNGNTIDSGSDFQNNETVVTDFCLGEGDYSFTIYDSYGDGICCFYGNGNYSLDSNNQTIVTGGDFGSSETTYFTIGNTGPGPGDPLTGYYSDANGLTGFQLKSALHTIVKNSHTPKSYSSIWGFYTSNSRDLYYENDNSFLDIYSENPNGNDPYTYTSTSQQCGNYSGEGDCYNREHSFPKSWFGSAAPMESDIHHIFLTDGYVNSKRSSYPYGEVGSASYTSGNGSKLGNASSGLGYSGTVFEPIDEFKGDIARAYFYMATRYEDIISGWENKSSYSDAVLNGTSSTVFEPWILNMLISWHNNDPVSQKEISRNEAAYQHQGNRNPYIDHPELVAQIWTSTGSREVNQKISNINSSSEPNTINNYQVVYSSSQNELVLKIKKEYDGQLSIYNTTGQQVLSRKIFQQETHIKINLQPKQVYIFNFKNEEINHSMKFMY